LGPGGNPSVANASDLQARVAELEDTLRKREQELAAARRELQALRAESASAGRASVSDSAGASTAEQLQQQLAEERAQRQALLQELEALRREVASPYAENRVPESEYLSVKQELVDLRRRLQALEEDRRRIADANPLGAEQSRSSRDAALAAEQRQLTQDVESELIATRSRVAQLESQLTEARQELERNAALASENTALREQLAEEKRRAEALEAKLKVAARVTELIFRMRSEGGEDAQRQPVSPR